MIWDIYWGLALGFILSSLVRAFIPAEKISKKLGRDSIGALGLSTFFGGISSSCSYAAASMARTLLIKGATWSNAVAFMVASTNLVFEIFIVIVSLLGWSFFGGEVLGGLFFIVISALLIRWIFPARAKQEAKAHTQYNESDVGNVHDHVHQHEARATMHDHSVHKTEDHGIAAKLKTASGHFYMDVTMVGKDILIGVVIASILMMVVPDGFWKTLFLTGNSQLPHFIVLCWNTLIGIIVAIIAFVCSVGNIVMAAVLWRGGISFGGVIAFILSDLVTIPMLMVFRSYFGTRPMLYLLLVMVISIFITAMFLDYSFAALHWLPKSQHGGMQMSRQHWQWNYGTWMDFLFIPLSVTYFFWGRKGMKA